MFINKLKKEGFFFIILNSMEFSLRVNQVQGVEGLSDKYEFCMLYFWRDVVI